MISFNQYIIEGLYPNGYNPYAGNQQRQQNNGGNAGTYVLGGLALAGAGAGGYYAYNQHRWNNVINDITNASAKELTAMGVSQTDINNNIGLVEKFGRAVQSQNRWTSPETAMRNFKNRNVSPEEFKAVMKNFATSVRESPMMNHTTPQQHYGTSTNNAPIMNHE